MLQTHRWQREQEVVVDAGWGGGGELEMTAQADRVVLPGPGGHLYTPQPPTSRWWAEPLAGWRHCRQGLRA